MQTDPATAPADDADPAALLEAAEAACARHDHRVGATLARDAMALSMAAGDAASVARAQATLAGLYLVTGEFELAGRLGRQALDHASEHGPPALIARICATLSFVYEHAGLAALAVEHAVRALEMARACGDMAAESLALNRLGTAVRGSEESARAIGMLEESVRLARTLPAPDAAFWPLNNLASRWIDEADRLIHTGQDPREALQCARTAALEGEALARASGVPLQRALIAANLAAIHRRLGEYEQARAYFVEAITLSHAEGATGYETTFWLALASLEVEAAPSWSGCAALEHELDRFPAAVNAELPLRARRVLAQAYRTLGDADRACAQLQRVLAETEAAAGRRADAQWRLMQTREELAQARHDAELSRTEAQIQRLHAQADAALARQLSQQRDRLEFEVAKRGRDLQQALVAAEAASRAKSAFLAVAAHELRTPLTGVLGMVELARRRSSDPQQRSQLDKALAAGRGLARQVEQLLDFVAEPAPGGPVVEATDVRRLAGDVVRAAQRDAEAKGLALSAAVAADVPLVVRLDAVRVHQVLATLVDNAVKFSSRGAVRLTARWSGGDAGEDRALLFEVADQGPGIPRDVQQRLFRPFEFGDGSYARAQGGLGLGLALVGRRVQAMGAMIEVDSEPGQGSTFRLKVPVEVGTMRLA